MIMYQYFQSDGVSRMTKGLITEDPMVLVDIVSKVN
jgi:hypothetical protein